ncbi:histidine kinase [Patulibacter defluvii]|uniref:histidine kinase n=1 Tax=Patulibacter defluvii TaxID=3095358 RepID=UPI002A747758|nr:histidine kinase [Patulibacter sp. DM4]
MSGVVRLAPLRRGAPELARRWREPLFWLVVAVTGVEGQLQALTEHPGSDGARIRLAAVAAISTVALAVCRRHPLPALLTILGGMTLSLFDDPGTIVYAPALGVLLVGYFVGRRSSDRATLLAVVATAVVLTVGELADGGDPTIAPMVVPAAPIALGRAVRQREAAHAALRDRAAAEEAARRDGAAQALLDERARIAGELHDVVAHALSAMVVQAGAARVLVGRRPPAAAAAFASVERTGRDALFEIRSLLGVLRAAGDEQELAPQPTLEHLPQLLRRAGADGLAVELEVVGAPQPLGAGASLAAYRAAQEALRAARGGGARRARVTVVHEAGAVRVDVDDDGGDRDPLVVRERILLYGGELLTSRLRDPAADRAGWHRTSVRLPREAAA